MNKLNLIALLAAPTLSPTTVVSVNQVTSDSANLYGVLDDHRIDEKKLEDSILKKLNIYRKNTGISKQDKEKFTEFYIMFDQKIKEDNSIIDTLFNTFKNKEPEAFNKDPTESFINYFFIKFADEVQNANFVENISDLQNIINNFITDINKPTFLNNFSDNNNGKAKFETEIDNKIKDLSYNDKISPLTLNPIKNKIKSKYEEMLMSLTSDENNYKNYNEPYIKEANFEQAIQKTIENEWTKEINGPNVVNAIQNTIENEFDILLKNENNINNDFSKKTIDYLKYYLKDQEENIDIKYNDKKDYFFKKLFGEDQSNWTQEVQYFWNKWFGANKGPNVDLDITYENFQNGNDKAEITLTFNVELNNISSISNTKSYGVKYKSYDDWDAKKIEKLINDHLATINGEVIKEQDPQGYKITEDANPISYFWDVLDAQLNSDLENQLFNNKKLQKSDFTIHIEKQNDIWIFKISINKSFANVSNDDPVDRKYNKLKMDDIIYIKFETIIYDIKKNLLKVDTLPLNPSKEDLRRSQIYGGAYKDDLQPILDEYSNNLITLEELEVGGKLREIFKTRYSENEINKFLEYIKSLSLGSYKYSQDNTPGGIGKIGYKYISNASGYKAGYFELVIENEKGVIKTPVVIKDDNLNIFKYENAYERFKEELANTSIKDDEALIPGQLTSSVGWAKLKQIIPILDSDVSSKGSSFDLNKFAHISGLVDGSLEDNFKIESIDNVIKVIFNLKDGNEYEKIISIDALSKDEKDDFKNKINNRLNEIKGYIDQIQDKDIKDKMENIYQTRRNKINDLLTTLQTKQDMNIINREINDLVTEIIESLSIDEKEKLLEEVKKRFPNGIPENINRKIKDYIDQAKQDILNKTPKEIRDILDNKEDLLKNLRENNIDINDLLNINKKLTNFEKYGIIALGGILAIDSVAAGSIAYVISRKNKKLLVTNKQKMKKTKSLIIFNILISLLTAGGSIAMFILIFIIKGGL